MFVRHDPKSAISWMAARGFPMTLELERAALEWEIAHQPWRALKKLGQSAETLQDISSAIYLACAKDNTAKTLKLFSEWQIPSEGLRARIFFACAERRFWQTLELVSDFSLSPAENEKAFHLALKKDPIRAIALINSLGLERAELIRASVRAAVIKNATQTIDLLDQVNLSPVEKSNLIQQALRRNPRIMSDKSKSIFSLIPTKEYPGVIAAYSKGNIKKALELCKTHSACRGLEHEIVNACALENYGRARKTAPPIHQRVIADVGFLDQLAVQAIVSGRWNSALEAIKMLSKVSVNEQIHQGSLHGTLNKLDAMIQNLEKREDLSLHESTNVTLIKKIRDANCIPTNIIQQTLDHFGEDDYPFLISVFERGGSSVCENIFSMLIKLYPIETDVKPLDRTIIDECIRAGFRGLSDEMMKRLRPIFSASIVRGRRVVQDYQRVAGKILDGGEITEDQIAPELFPSLVVAAYRPVGLSVEQVRGILGTIRDQSAHLKRFTYPQLGYGVSLQGVSQVALRPGKQIDPTTFTRCKEILLRTAIVPLQRPLTVPVLMKRLIEGGFDQINLSEAWDLIRIHSNDTRIVQFTTQAIPGFEEGRPLRERLKSLSICRELFSVVAYDAMSELTNQTLNHTDPNQRFRVTPKIQESTRKILRLPESSEIGTDEIQAALEVQIEKLFKTPQIAISREAKKFDLHLNEVSDRFVLILTKNKSSYFGRAGAGLCTGQENWSWNNSDFLQMVMVDKEKGQIVGNIQLHLFANEQGQRSVLARLNPTTMFLNTINKNTLAQEMLRAVQQFAADNSLQPYLPEQTGWHQLTNRDDFAPPLQRYFGKGENTRIQITANHTVSRIYRMLPIN